jgi:type VI protein secretion system component VasK
MGTLKAWLTALGSLILIIITCGWYLAHKNRRRETALHQAIKRAERAEAENEILEDMRALDAIYIGDPRWRLLAKARLTRAIAGGTAADVSAERARAGLPERRRGGRN